MLIWDRGNNTLLRCIVIGTGLPYTKTARWIDGQRLEIVLVSPLASKVARYLTCVIQDRPCDNLRNNDNLNLFFDGTPTFAITGRTFRWIILSPRYRSRAFVVIRPSTCVRVSKEMTPTVSRMFPAYKRRLSHSESFILITKWHQSQAPRSLPPTYPSRNLPMGYRSPSTYSIPPLLAMKIIPTMITSSLVIR